MRSFTQSNHTQGQWVAGRHDMGTVIDGMISKCVYSGDQMVAIAFGGIAGEWDEVMANAYLIAAAPDLLAVVEKFIERCDELGIKDFNMKLLPEARTAIAKAKGEVK